MNLKLESSLTPPLKRMIHAVRHRGGPRGLFPGPEPQSTRGRSRPGERWHPRRGRPRLHARPGTRSRAAALPDFSQLVDRYGPAVVNVEVVEKAPARGRGLQGLSPNDPFYDFFSGASRARAGQGRAPTSHRRGARAPDFIINSDGYHSHQHARGGQRR